MDVRVLIELASVGVEGAGDASLDAQLTCLSMARVVQ
jgi:hypothetical protein